MGPGGLVWRISEGQKVREVKSGLEGEVGGRVGTGPAGTRCLEEAMKAVRLVD